MGLDPMVVNEELKTALEKQLQAEIMLLNVKKSKQLAFENARASAAAKCADGKAPSEAACERIAKSDSVYLKQSDLEIGATNSLGQATIAVEYLRNKFQVALALAKK